MVSSVIEQSHYEDPDFQTASTSLQKSLNKSKSQNEKNLLYALNNNFVKDSVTLTTKELHDYEVAISTKV